MGYQITFTPSEEKMKEYKPWANDTIKNLEDSLLSIKREIVSTCMKNNKEESFYKIEQALTFKVKYYVRTVKDLEKYYAYERWKEDEDHDLWYCGWQFARESSMDEDFIIESTIDKLLILADIVETPEYFENSERFYDKWNEIKEEVEGLKESIEDIAIHEIINDLKDFEKHYGDEDEEAEDECIGVESGDDEDNEPEDVCEFAVGTADIANDDIKTTSKL